MSSGRLWAWEKRSFQTPEVEEHGSCFLPREVVERLGCGPLGVSSRAILYGVPSVSVRVSEYNHNGDTRGSCCSCFMATFVFSISLRSRNFGMKEPRFLRIYIGLWQSFKATVVLICPRAIVWTSLWRAKLS